MNNIRLVNTEYLRASRTIETVLVSKSQLDKVFFIYNYEGYSFRVFKNHISLINFFNNRVESDWHFHTEAELDKFLFEVEI